MRKERAERESKARRTEDEGERDRGSRGSEKGGKNSPETEEILDETRRVNLRHSENRENTPAMDTLILGKYRRETRGRGMLGIRDSEESDYLPCIEKHRRREKKEWMKEREKREQMRRAVEQEIQFTQGAYKGKPEEGDEEQDLFQRSSQANSYTATRQKRGESAKTRREGRKRLSARG